MNFDGCSISQGCEIATRSYWGFSSESIGGPLVHLAQSDPYLTRFLIDCGKEALLCTGQPNAKAKRYDD